MILASRLKAADRYRLSHEQCRQVFEDRAMKVTYNPRTDTLTAMLKEVSPSPKAMRTSPA